MRDPVGISVMAGLPRLSSSKATQSTAFSHTSMKKSHHVGRDGKRFVYTRRGYFKMNSSVVFIVAHESSAVTALKTLRPVQMISLRKRGYAVLPARIISPMVMRTKYAPWKGIMLASRSDMPELLKAETPLKTPSHQGFIPLALAVLGMLRFIHAPSATHPRTCHRKK